MTLFSVVFPSAVRCRRTWSAIDRMCICKGKQSGSLVEWSYH